MKIEEAVDSFVKRIPEPELRDLDRQVQEMVQTKLKSLVNICLSSQAPQLLGELEAHMQTVAEKFVAARMTESDAADFFLKQYEEETSLRCYLLVDKSASMAYKSDETGLTKLEYASFLAASLVLSCWCC